MIETEYNPGDAPPADQGRWPVTTAFVARLLAHPAFAKLRSFEELLLRTPIPDHRQALLRAGAPVCEQSHGEAGPRRGILSI